MGASVLSMLLLVNASVSHWSNEKGQDSSDGKKGGDACGASLAKGGRIVGGRNATEGEFPWMVALLNKDGVGFNCGGSIIEPDIVVTAAHCVQRDANTYTVLAGALDYKKPPKYSQLRNVQKITVHESYLETSADYDIALMKLEVPFSFTESEGHISAVCLPAEDRRVEGEVEVTGWGDTIPVGPGSPHLLAVIVPIKPCDEKDDQKILFCVGSPGKGICDGDSGGPAVQKESSSSIIVGVLAARQECDVGLGIYTKVSAFTAWISENIAKLRL